MVTEIRVSLLAGLLATGGVYFVSRQLRVPHRWSLLHTNATRITHRVVLQDYEAALNAIQADSRHAVRKGFSQKEAESLISLARAAIRRSPLLLTASVANGLSFVGASILALGRAHTRRGASSASGAGTSVGPHGVQQLVAPLVSAAGVAGPIRTSLLALSACALPVALLAAVLPLRFFSAMLSPDAVDASEVRRKRVVSVLLHALGYYWCVASGAPEALMVAATHTLVPLMIAPRLRGGGVIVSPGVKVERNDTTLRLEVSKLEGVYGTFVLDK